MLDREEQYATHYETIYPAHVLVRDTPNHMVGIEVDPRFNEGYLGTEFRTPETFVARIPDARLWGSHGAVITPNNLLLADVSIEFGVTPRNGEDHSIFDRRSLEQPLVVDAVVACLAAAGGDGYFHWMFDVLPRQHLLDRSSMSSADEIEVYLLNEIRQNFQKESLELLGIPLNKVMATRPDLHVRVKDLVLPSLPGITGAMPAWTCRFLRKTFLREEAVTDGANEDRIYISRADASHRKVLNEEEVIDMLKSNDFDIVHLDGKTVAVQAELFSRAAIVIAPHGAGLTNLVFCRQGTRVAELFSSNYVNPCYRGLSTLCGLEYWYLLNGEQRNSGDRENHLARSVGDSFFVKIEQLSTLLDDMTGADRTR